MQSMHKGGNEEAYILQTSSCCTRIFFCQLIHGSIKYWSECNFQDRFHHYHHMPQLRLSFHHYIEVGEKLATLLWAPAVSHKTGAHVLVNKKISLKSSWNLVVRFHIMLSHLFITSVTIVRSQFPDSLISTLLFPWILKFKLFYSLQTKIIPKV
jgi:hypothetical protein